MKENPLFFVGRSYAHFMFIFNCVISCPRHLVIKSKLLCVSAVYYVSTNKQEEYV